MGQGTSLSPKAACASQTSGELITFTLRPWHSTVCSPSQQPLALWGAALIHSCNQVNKCLSFTKTSSAEPLLVVSEHFSTLHSPLTEASRKKDVKLKDHPYGSSQLFRQTARFSLSTCDIFIILFLYILLLVIIFLLYSSAS